MKSTSMIAGALSLALLAGCGAAAGDPDDLTFQSMGVPRSSQLVTVNGVDVTAGEYMFALLSSVDQWGLTVDYDWEQTVGEGEDAVTVNEFVKDDTLQALKLHVVLKEKAQELGYTISEAEEQQLQDAYANFVEGIGGQEKLEKWLEEYCTTEEAFLEYNRAVLYSQGVRAKLAETGALELTDEDVEQYIQDGGYYAAKHILISTRHDMGNGSYEEFTQDERNAALEEAKALRAQILAADDVNAEFDQVMNERSDDGRDPEGKLYTPEGYQLVKPGQMVSPFEEGTLALDVGEISEPVQSVFGYHIILRLEVDREKAQAQAEMEDYKLNSTMVQWVDEAEVTTTKAYDELNAKEVFVRHQEILDARAAAEATPAPSQAPETSPAPED